MGVTFNPFSGTFDFTGTGGSSSGIGGTIAATQVAFGTAPDTIGGSDDLTFDDTTDSLALGATIDGLVQIAGDALGVELTVTGGPGAVNHQSGNLNVGTTIGHGGDSGNLELFTGADDGGGNSGAIHVSTGHAFDAGTVYLQPGPGDHSGGGIIARAGDGVTFGGDIELRAGAGATHGGSVTMMNRDQQKYIFVNDNGIFVQGDVELSDGSALRTDDEDAHTVLLQAYDVDGTAYKTFGTLTNGNTPSFALAAPSGGSLTGNFSTLQVGGTNVLTVSGSGTALTFPGTLSIASGKILTASNTLTFTGTDSTSFAFPGTSDTVVALTATQTLTNKRITKRVTTASDATSITPNTDSADVTYQANTQAAGTLTINDDGGAPTNGQAWLLKIKSTSVQTFAWNSRYVGGTIALPTATTGTSKIDNYAFLYDTVNSKWEYTGSAGGF